MNCVRAEKEVLLNNSADKSVAAHLQVCAECRAIAETLAKFIKAKPDAEKYKIPKAIDASITSEAHAFFDERQHNQTAAASPMVRPFHTWATIFAYAACFLLVAWMLIIVLSSARRPNDIDTAKLSVNLPLSPEIKNWDKLEMRDELFILNTEIEINFAALSFSDDIDDAETEDDDENTIEIKDSMI